MRALKSWLPPGGQNVFQEIKNLCAQAEQKGQKLWKLTIGQPQGPASLVARKACAKLVLSGQENVHEYQDNGSPGVPDFAKTFVLRHLPEEKQEGLAATSKFLPIPGIKPILGLIPLACGRKNLTVGTMTNPGYPTPADWCKYLDVCHYHLRTDQQNQFRFKPDWAPVYGRGDIMHHTKLLMVNFPHNPSGQIATKEYWLELCDFCAKNDIRLFNDAAYAFLVHTPEATSLSEVAVEFPKLSWAEAFSASKLILNGTGWRIGALIGSPDFIGDIATVKGNTDSGFFAPAAAGVLTAILNDSVTLRARREVYEIRLEILIKILQSCGLRLAVQPRGTFFSLWLAPSHAFGLPDNIVDGAGFNRQMIANTGIVGVPFGNYIRYAVAGAPLEKVEWQEALYEGFAAAQPSYF